MRWERGVCDGTGRKKRRAKGEEEKRVRKREGGM